jgi:hypothetical protein
MIPIRTGAEGIRILAASCESVAIPIGRVDSAVRPIDRLEELLDDFKQSDRKGKTVSSAENAVEQPCFPIFLSVDGGGAMSIDNLLTSELT